MEKENAANNAGGQIEGEQTPQPQPDTFVEGKIKVPDIEEKIKLPEKKFFV